MRKTVLKIYGCIGSIGFLYYIWISMTGIKIPCFYYCISGYQCAGCGLTRMCLALVHLDVKRAFSYNPGMFLAIILWNVIAGLIMIGRPGFIQNKRFLYGVFWITVAALFLWGFARNFI